ncbi:hypothetical protein Tco_1022044, partial [Tanacetum coccineum]
HAEFDEYNANVLERFYTLAGNHVKEILLKLNLPNHRTLKDGGKDFRYSLMTDSFLKRRSIKSKNLGKTFRHSLLIPNVFLDSDEVVKVNESFKKDATLKAFPSQQIKKVNDMSVQKSP